MKSVIALIGDSKVGKTTLIKLLDKHDSDFFFLELEPAFEAENIPESAKGAIVMFDLTSSRSYKEAFNALVDLQFNTFPVLYVGNKTDLGNRQVSAEEVNEDALVADEDSLLSHVRVLEVSAKTGFNTDHIINFFVSELTNGERYDDPILFVTD